VNVSDNGELNDPDEAVMANAPPAADCTLTDPPLIVTPARPAWLTASTTRPAVVMIVGDNPKSIAIEADKVTSRETVSKLGAERRSDMVPPARFSSRYRPEASVVPDRPAFTPFVIWTLAPATPTALPASALKTVPESVNCGAGAVDGVVGGLFQRDRGRDEERRRRARPAQ
jgi:hypothetical protein